MQRGTATGQSKPGWLTRNWKWAVPVGCLGALGALAAFVAGIAFVVFGAMRSSDAAQFAIAQSVSHPELQAQLGQPIEPGFFLTGNVNVSGTIGQADLAIPVSGPRGAATVYVVGQRSAGQWHYQTLEAELSNGQRLNLLPEDLGK